MRAGTLRVVFAAKLLKKLISTHLVYLVLKLLSVPVPAQRRHARASRRLPYLDGIVPAATSNLFAVRTEGNTRDIAVKSSKVSTQHTLENKQE
jgi:hypothetical protein